MLKFGVSWCKQGDVVGSEWYDCVVFVVDREIVDKVGVEIGNGFGFCVVDLSGLRIRWYIYCDLCCVGQIMIGVVEC